MPTDAILLATLLLAAVAAVASLLALRAARGGEGRAEAQHLRLLAEQALASSRSEGETTRAGLAAMERAMGARAEASRLELQSTLGTLHTALVRDQGEARALLETKLREMGEQGAARLASIQRAVHEQLHEAVEKQMETSFQRVVDQFGQLQKAMTDVQAVTAQIGDIKRVFSNVKSRGFWAETQLRTLLDDIMPGNYETNCRVREDSADVVEFCVLMPVKGDVRPMLAIDSKFPTEDYDRLLLAAEAGDAEGERAARRGLETRLRAEGRKIADKYINPPVTVEFAVLYLPTDGLYVEAARMPGLLDDLSRARVLIVGPSLAPALLRTIQLGFVTLALEQNAGQIRSLLGATRTEMGKMDEVLERLHRQAGTFGKTIETARIRTRAVGRKLRAVDALEAGHASELLELEDVAGVVPEDA